MSKAKTSAIKEKQTKSQIIAVLAEDTGLTKKQVQSVLQSAKALARDDIRSSSSPSAEMPLITASRPALSGSTTQM